MWWWWWGDTYWLLISLLFVSLWLDADSSDATSSLTDGPPALRFRDGLAACPSPAPAGLPRSAALGVTVTVVVPRDADGEASVSAAAAAAAAGDTGASVAAGPTAGPAPSVLVTRETSKPSDSKHQSASRLGWGAD